MVVYHMIQALARPRILRYRQAEMQSFRVLVVDDFASFRECVCGMLRGTQFRVVGQAADGLDAVQKARRCQPDLILLDIGLPKLNGIEAVRRISVVASGEQWGLRIYSQVSDERGATACSRRCSSWRKVSQWQSSAHIRLNPAPRPR